MPDTPAPADSETSIGRVAAADASTNGAALATAPATGSHAELPLGELKWDPLSGEASILPRRKNGDVLVLSTMDSTQADAATMCGLVSPEGECTAAGGRSFLTSLALLRALPWRKFKKGSTLVIEVRVHVATCCAPVFMHWNLPPLLWCAAQSIIPCIRQHLPPLSMQLGGAINDQKGGRFSPPTNIPTLCEALQKAALDPRIEGVYFKVTGRASLIARTGRL